MVRRPRGKLKKLKNHLCGSKLVTFIQQFPLQPMIVTTYLDCETVQSSSALLCWVVELLQASMLRPDRRENMAWLEEGGAGGLAAPLVG